MARVVPKFDSSKIGDDDYYEIRLLRAVKFAGRDLAPGAKSVVMRGRALKQIDQDAILDAKQTDTP